MGDGPGRDPVLDQLRAGDDVLLVGAEQSDGIEGSHGGVVPNKTVGMRNIPRRRSVLPQVDSGPPVGLPPRLRAAARPGAERVRP
ncbi:hypothetical protein GCM10010442_54970 [Kitasatospora kifunensis]